MFDKLFSFKRHQDAGEAVCAAARQFQDQVRATEMAEGAWQPAAQDRSLKKGRPRKLAVGQSGPSSDSAGGPASRIALIAHFQVKKFILKKHF